MSINQIAINSPRPVMPNVDGGEADVLSDQVLADREKEIRAGLAAVKADALPELAPIDDGFVISLAARLVEIAPAPLERKACVELALFEARALAISAPLVYLREDVARLPELLSKVARLEARIAELEQRDASSSRLPA
ncbi:hypothetical protein [Streptomyces nigrescens]|uniref:hypothetical protein n=1 Tax=Streptomyces nigrescens TaxID=1920 RepID=UPI0036950655